MSFIGWLMMLKMVEFEGGDQSMMAFIGGDEYDRKRDKRENFNDC